MTKFAIVSEFACALSWWKRLQDEGHEVKVWIKPKEMKFVGDGIVPKAGTFFELLQWASSGPSIVLFDSSGLGDLAEIARARGFNVIGGGRFADRLEKDRSFGFKMAESVGAQLPPYEDFGNFDECLAFARDMDEETPVYFKSDRYLVSDATHGSNSREGLVDYLEYIIRTFGSSGRCMLQQKIDGVPLSTARWWNGKAWVGPYEYTIEHKKFMAGEVGPSTGCSLNAVWFEYDESLVAKSLGWERLAEPFQRYNAPPGLYDINAIIHEGVAYFLEWTPRFGYDSEMTSGRLFSNLGKMLEDVALGKSEPSPSTDLAYAVRLSIPPYPWEHSKKTDLHSCQGTYVKGDVGNLWSKDFIAYQLREGKDGYEMACAEGIIGLVYAQGDSLSKMHKKAISWTKDELDVPGLQYRTDGDKILAEDAENLKKAGVDPHPALML